MPVCSCAKQCALNEETASLWTSFGVQPNPQPRVHIVSGASVQGRLQCEVGVLTSDHPKHPLVWQPFRSGKLPVQLKEGRVAASCNQLTYFQMKGDLKQE